MVNVLIKNQFKVEEMMVGVIEMPKELTKEELNEFYNLTLLQNLLKENGWKLVLFENVDFEDIVSEREEFYEEQEMYYETVFRRVEKLTNVGLYFGDMSMLYRKVDKLVDELSGAAKTMKASGYDVDIRDAYMVCSIAGMQEIVMTIKLDDEMQSLVVQVLKDENVVNFEDFRTALMSFGYDGEDNRRIGFVIGDIEITVKARFPKLITFKEETANGIAINNAVSDIKKNTGIDLKKIIDIYDDVKILN